MNRDVIRLHGLKYAARHGVAREERTLPQPFEVDVEISCDLCAAAVSDRLKDTIDYGVIARIVGEVVEGVPRKLLEKIAGDIVERLSGLVHEGIITVRIRKPRAPLAQLFDFVEVELCRRIGG